MGSSVSKASSASKASSVGMGSSNRSSSNNSKASTERGNKRGRVSGTSNDSDSPNPNPKKKSTVYAAKRRSPVANSTMTNANNPMDKDTTTDDILGGDIVLQYMDKEMGDDSCSTLTDVAYQADVLEEGGIYDKNADVEQILKEELVFEVNEEVSTKLSNANLSFEDVVKVYSFLYLMEDDGLKTHKSSRTKKSNLKNESNGIRSIFNHMGIKNFALLYATPTKYVHDYINNKNAPTSKKDVFSKIATFPLKCMLMNEHKDKIPKEELSEFNPFVFELASLVPKESIDVYKKWSGIYMQLCHQSTMDKVENSPFYDWDSIMENMPKLIMKSDPNMVQLSSWRDLLIVSLYKEYPARDDYGYLRLIRDSTKEDYSAIQNYFLLDKKRFHIADYKQHKKTPIDLKIPIEHTVSNATMRVVESYLALFYKMNNKYPDYLITKDDGTLYGTDDGDGTQTSKDGKLSGIIGKMFRKHTNCHFVNIGVNELRHAKVAKHRGDSMRKQQALAFMMRHSIGVHQMYARESTSIMTIPCGYPIGNPLKQPLHDEDREDDCDLREYEKSATLPTKCLLRKVVVKENDQYLVGKIKAFGSNKAKKKYFVEFLKKYKKKNVELKDLTLSDVKLLPKSYTELLKSKFVGKQVEFVVNHENIKSRLEENMDEKTNAEYPYVVTYMSGNKKTLKQFLVYDAESILLKNQIS